MTKVNENGQLEWTFEELDLDGTYEIVSKEMDLIKREMNILSKALKNAVIAGDISKISDRLTVLSYKHSNLYDVCKLILNLKYWKKGVK